ncbi:fumarylacetoacetate hydrolase family protein [Gammaproteobacteria bacterium]|nr:fumarylacetoacetate hydrolase family protein [Gammaproteobacteria bacterium]
MGFKLANIDGKSALIHGDSYYDINSISQGEITSDPSYILDSLDDLHDLSSKIDNFEPTGLIENSLLGAPVTNSRNCYAVGLNYRAHAEESGMEIPPFPMVFTKHTSCIVGPFDNIEMRSDIVDYEAELVLVIGKKGKNISKETAWDHVAGLTVGQDISDRAVQFHATPAQFNLGKSFDTFGPIGPYLVSPDSVANKNAVQLECHINNELRQESSTDDLIFTVPDIISYISEFLTLNTGDLIFTGTPSGVGATQGKLLKDGDIITTSIKEIGTIKNKCIRINDHSYISYMPEFLKGRIPTNDDS